MTECSSEQMHFRVMKYPARTYLGRKAKVHLFASLSQPCHTRRTCLVYQIHSEEPTRQGLAASSPVMVRATTP